MFVVAGAPNAKGVVAVAAGAAPNVKGAPLLAAVVVAAPNAKAGCIASDFWAGAPNANGAPASAEAAVVVAGARGVAVPAIGACAPNLNGAAPVGAAGVLDPNAKLGDVAVATLAGAVVAAPNVKPPLFGWAPMPAAAPSGDCMAVEPKAGGAVTAASFAVVLPEPKLNMFVLAMLGACDPNGVIWDTGAAVPN